MKTLPQKRTFPAFFRLYLLSVSAIIIAVIFACSKLFVWISKEEFL